MLKGRLSKKQTDRVTWAGILLTVLFGGVALISTVTYGIQMQVINTQELYNCTVLDVIRDDLFTPNVLWKVQAFRKDSPPVGTVTFIREKCEDNIQSKLRADALPFLYSAICFHYDDDYGKLHWKSASEGYDSRANIIVMSVFILAMVLVAAISTIIVHFWGHKPEPAAADVELNVSPANSQ